MFWRKCPRREYCEVEVLGLLICLDKAKNICRDNWFCFTVRIYNMELEFVALVKILWRLFVQFRKVLYYSVLYSQRISVHYARS